MSRARHAFGALACGAMVAATVLWWLPSFVLALVRLGGICVRFEVVVGLGRALVALGWPEVASRLYGAVTHFEGKRLNSPNDVTVAADGAVWFTDPIFGILMPNQGSLVEPELDHRSVYRFDPAIGDLRRMADFEQPNGLFFAPDGRTLYVSDTARSLGEIIGGHERDTHEIIAFDVGADGTLSNRRFFLRTDHGYPDGFAVDARGWVWTSSGDGIQIYAPDRTKLGFFPTPATPSNCCFGGKDMGRFFVAAKDYLLAIDLRPTSILGRSADFVRHLGQ